MTSGDRDTPPTPAPPNPHGRGDIARDVLSSAEKMLRRSVASLRLSMEARQKYLTSLRYAAEAGAPGFLPADAPRELPRNSAQDSRSDFLGLLGDEQRRAFTAVAREHAFTPGTVLMREGERADFVLAIRSGQTQVTVREGTGERLIAVCGPGQLIGERGALRVNVRSATVTTVGEVRGLLVPTGDFARFISAHPDVLDIIEGQIYERLTHDPVEHKRRFLADDFRPDPLPPASVELFPHALAGENCTVLNTDVVGFGALRRNDNDRRVVRLATRDMLRACLGQAWPQCVIGDQGDGLLIVVPPSVPTADVIRPLHRELPDQLRRHNALYHEAASIRLRVAINVGPVTSDDVGISGEAIIRAARLIDAPPLRRAMADSDAALGIIVSDFVYDTAIKNSDEWINASEYKAVRVRVKESSFPGWLRLTGQAAPEFQLRAQ
jgi:class 3 adenylate cyclase